MKKQALIYIVCGLVCTYFGFGSCGGDAKNAKDASLKEKSSIKEEEENVVREIKSDIRPPDSACPEGLKEKKVDLNSDMKPDVWKYYKIGAKDEILVCKEMDINFDGKIDVRRFYNDIGEITKEQFDLDFDGKMDVTNIYVDNVLELKEVDTNLDGKPDVFYRYSEGKLIQKDRDTNFNGKLDEFEYYEGDKISKIRIDKNEDGIDDDVKINPELSPAN